MDLKSIISIEKIENNLEWVGLAAGALTDFGLETPLVYANRLLTEGAAPPRLDSFKYHLLEYAPFANVTRTGLLMAIGGAIGNRVLGGMGARASRAAEKFGTGLVLGVAIDAFMQCIRPINTVAVGTLGTQSVYSP